MYVSSTLLPSFFKQIPVIVPTTQTPAIYAGRNKYREIEMLAQSYEL